MTPPSVSVCVVSWHRPKALQRCLIALGQMDHPNFEIVVVADEAALAALTQTVPFRAQTAPYANISVARNLAIAQSAGDIVAFIDDDAVPEPTWLRRLCAPFQKTEVAATGGYVRGRNGISWQWRGRVVNRLGETQAYNPGDPVPDGFFVKTEGTNMAIRRGVLCEMGGFDPLYAYFLDDTDMNIRLGVSGHYVELVPDAVVHHGFLPSATRRKDRSPKDLGQIGTSWSVFLRKHASASDIEPRRNEIRTEQHVRVLEHMVRGNLEPRDVRKLRTSLEQGFLRGNALALAVPVPLEAAPSAFLRVSSRHRRHIVMTCGPYTARQKLAEAQEHIRSGENVTVCILSHTALYHSTSFTIDGIWVHRGGVYGKSQRDQPLFQLWRRHRRAAAEMDRIARERNIAT